MKTNGFTPYPFLAPKPFRRVTLRVCISWSTHYKESYASRLFGLQLNDNNSMLRLLLLKLIAQTILRTIIRMVETYYNPHRKAGLIPLRRPAAPRSGFALGI